MIKKILALSISATMVCTLAGCDVSSSITDIKSALQNEVTNFPVNTGYEIIEQAPEDIVVLDDNVADILIACGYTDKIVGKSSDCTQSELKNVKEYGSDKNPDTNAVNKLDIDLIFASPDINYSDYEAMKNDNNTVLRIATTNSIENFDTLYSNICKIMSGNIDGAELGKEKAKYIVSELEKSESNSVIKGCYLYKLDGQSAVTNEMYENEILSLAGVQNIATEYDRNGNLAISKILAADKQEGFPFYILCEKGMKSKILSDENFKGTSVVNKNRIIEIPSEYLSRQGKSAIEGVKYIENALKTQSVENGKDISEDYGITLFDGISYTLDEEDNYVLAIQKRLDDLGYLPIEPTGYFGDSTAQAVKDFQVNNELNRRDGVADQETLERLFSTSAFSRTTPVKDSSSENTATESPTEIATFSTTIIIE